ncbi:MAG TPA: glycosyltransferase [Desulfomonilaceae bacterium]|nr:glycosyltransferase [Desulfomonilaceae bacterium]
MLAHTPFRVLMLSHSVYIRDTRIRRLAEYLGDEGHFVDVICLASDTGEIQSPHPRVKVYPLPVSRHRKAGLLHVLEWVLSCVMMFLFTCWLDLKYHYHLIHTHNMPDFIVFCALFPRMRGCPVILNIHDVTPQLARSKLGVTEHDPLIRILSFVEMVSIKFSTHVITETPAAEKKLISRGAPPKKITVVMNAADPRAFPPKAANDDSLPGEGNFTLLYVGTVAARYGLPVAVKALPLLQAAIPDIRLKIVPKVRDEGKGLDDLLLLAKHCGVAGLVEIGEPVPLDRMPGIMKQAHIGVYPAIQDCHMDVSPSLKIAEMVNMGLPIAATGLSWLEDLYGSDSIAFFPSGDHEALAERVLDLYRSPEKRLRLTKSAVNRGAAVSWEAQYEIYRKLVDSLVKHF